MAGTGNYNNYVGRDPPTRMNNVMHPSRSDPNFQGNCKKKDQRFEGPGRNGTYNVSGTGARVHSNTNTYAPDQGRTNDNNHHNNQQQAHAFNQKYTNNNRGRQRNGGYKNDSAGRAKTKSNVRVGRSHKPHAESKAKKNNYKQTRRQRTKSEPRHHQSNRDKPYENAKGAKNNSRDATQKSRHRDAAATRGQQKRQQRRSRAKSAPARCRVGRNKQYEKDNYPTTSNINKKDSSKNNANIPKEFFCPLTKRLMKDPVVDREGNAYEKEAIWRWLQVHNSSPITNSYLSVEMLRPDRELKRAIYKATGKPRSKSHNRTKSARSFSPTNDLNSGRVLIDSYLREISSKSKLSISLDGMGICAFSYRRLTFVIEVPITPHAGFMVYSSFNGNTRNKLNDKIDAWNAWLLSIGRHSRVSYVKVGKKTVFTLNGGEEDMAKCNVFQKTLEYFVEMSLKLHNLLHPKESKVVENVCLTRAPVVT